VDQHVALLCEVRRLYAPVRDHHDALVYGVVCLLDLLRADEWVIIVSVCWSTVPRHGCQGRKYLTWNTVNIPSLRFSLLPRLIS
jgi:hypothetical protein